MSTLADLQSAHQIVVASQIKCEALQTALQSEIAFLEQARASMETVRQALDATSKATLASQLQAAGG